MQLCAHVVVGSDLALDSLLVMSCCDWFQVSCLDLISYMRKCTAVIAAGVCTFQNGLVALQGCDGLVLIESMVNSTAEKVVIPNNPSLQAPALRSHRAEGSH